MNFFASLYLLKTEEEIISAVSFNINNKESLDEYINKLEFKILNNNQNSIQDPFIQIMANNLSF